MCAIRTCVRGGLASSRQIPFAPHSRVRSHAHPRFLSLQFQQVNMGHVPREHLLAVAPSPDHLAKEVTETLRSSHVSSTQSGRCPPDERTRQRRDRGIMGDPRTDPLTPSRGARDFSHIKFSNRAATSLCAGTILRSVLREITGPPPPGGCDRSGTSLHLTCT